MGPTLVFYPNALPLRIIGSALLMGAMAFALVFAELVFRDEFLTCQPPESAAARCTHVSRWPFMAPRESLLSPIVGARTRASSSRNGTNVVLLLEHQNRTVSEFQGVGALGAEAETTALQLQDHLGAGQQAITLPLRSSNVPFGIGLFLVFFVLPLLLFPGLFSRIRVWAGPNPRIEVGRGILPARTLLFDRSTLPDFVVEERVINGNTVYVLRVVAGENALDMVTTRNRDDCRVFGERMQGALAEQRT